MKLMNLKDADRAVKSLREMAATFPATGGSLTVRFQLHTAADTMADEIARLRAERRAKKGAK